MAMETKCISHRCTGTILKISVQNEKETGIFNIEVHWNTGIYHGITEDLNKFNQEG